MSPTAGTLETSLETTAIAGLESTVSQGDEATGSTTVETTQAITSVPGLEPPTSISDPPITTSEDSISTTITTDGTLSSSNPPGIPSAELSQDSSGLPGGAIAGIVIGVVGVVALALVAIFFLHRRKRRFMSQKEEESNKPRDLPSRAMASRRHSRDGNMTNPNPSTAPRVQFDDPLDDIGLTKLFDQLDDRISDHIVNFNLQENMQTFTGYPEIEGPKASGEGILFRGNSLLGRQSSRLYMLRALFAYHVFGSIADQIIFTKEQRHWIRQAARGDRATRRAMICRQLETKDQFASAVDLLYGYLERETQIHVSPNTLKSENRQASLREISRSAALAILRLGLQRDSFKLGFLFHSSDYSQVEGVIPYEHSAIKDFRANPEYYQSFGEAGHDGVVSAMISPSVYRRPNGEHKYLVRRMKVFMAPRTLKQQREY